MDYITLMVLGLSGLGVYAVAGHLRDLVRLSERIATALERERDPIAKMNAALKDIKATADAEVARRKAQADGVAAADRERVARMMSRTVQ